MNEWELQKNLKKEYLRELLIFEEKRYRLVCWELMFPSWKINDKKGKWDEPSVDFIFYSEGDNQFLCVELKNNLRFKKDLLSAYCQVIHRTIKFIKQYSIEKISSANKLCLEHLSNEATDYTGIKEPITFQENPRVLPVLMANSFHSGSHSLVNLWDSYSLELLKQETNGYARNMEFKRINEISEIEFELVRKNKVRTIELRKG